jgi:hypothetical protein
MSYKYLALPFIIFIIGVFILLILQHLYGKNYLKNLLIAFLTGFFFLIIFNIFYIKLGFVYLVVVYILLFYLLANFLQQNQSGIQLDFLKKIYFTKDKKIKLNKFYNKNFEKEKFKKTLKKLYAMNIIKKEKKIFVNSKFIYLFYSLIVLIRKLYNIK